MSDDNQSSSPCRERAEQDLALEKAKLAVHIREQVAKNGPIVPAPKKDSKGDNNAQV